MSTLREVQSTIRNRLPSSDNGALLSFRSSKPVERMEIYRNSHIDSLIDVLKFAFPTVSKIVGESFFDGAAEVFVQKHPQVNAYLYDYSAEFPQFLEEFGPASELKYLKDVAELDWAASCAIHAPDAEPLDRARLVEIPPIDLGRIVFIPHPSVSLLHANFPSDDIWQAVLEGDDTAMANIAMRESPRWLLIERYEGKVRVVRLSDTAAWFAAHVFGGRPLQMALESSDDDAPAFLADHLAHGRFTGMKLLGSET
jgi:hypothetical protein